MPTIRTLLALDLATRCGFAVGAPGTTPRSGSILLRTPKERRGDALSHLIGFLQEQFEHPLDLVAVEAPLPLQAYRTLGNSEAAVRLAYGLHAVVEAMCARHGIWHAEAADSTIRKHFLGKGRLGNRADTKRAVVQRCRLLKLMPPDCSDDNRADALAVFEWASANYARRSVGTDRLFLFGEGGSP